jgi:hypothetical protein
MPKAAEPKSFKRKKKVVEEPVDAPSESIDPPVQFITMQELLESAGMIAPGDEEGVEPEIDESPKWEVAIDGMQPLECGGVKFSVFTPGEGSSGQMVCEFRAKPGMNTGLFSWLQKPTERKVRMTVKDHEEDLIEKWEMTAIPVALAVDELDREVKDPWFTTLQMSVRDIRIS